MNELSPDRLGAGLALCFSPVQIETLLEGIPAFKLAEAMDILSELSEVYLEYKEFTDQMRAHEYSEEALNNDDAVAYEIEDLWMENHNHTPDEYRVRALELLEDLRLSF